MLTHEDASPHSQAQKQFANSRVANLSEERLEQRQGAPSQAHEEATLTLQDPDVPVTSLEEQQPDQIQDRSSPSPSPTAPTGTLIGRHLSRVKRFLNRFVLITNSRYRSYELSPCEAVVSESSTVGTQHKEPSSSATAEASHSHSEQVVAHTESN